MSIRAAVMLALLVAFPLAGRADPVVDELGRRMHLSRDELTTLLAGCEGADPTQASLNTCAFRDLVKADLEMAKAVDRKLTVLPQSCRTLLQRHQASWRTAMEAACDRDADRQAKGGSIRPMVYSMCAADSTARRTHALNKMHSCQQVH